MPKNRPSEGPSSGRKAARSAKAPAPDEAMRIGVHDPGLPEPPTDLGARGRAFWEHVVAGWELGADHLVLLEEICRTLDTLQRLAGQTDAASLREARQQRAILSRMLAQLGLEHDDGETMPSPASERARKAAEARWQHHEKHRKGGR